MAGKVIVITSGKGGVGKTTAVANVGCAMALRGRSVVMVDTDIGLRNLDLVLGLENRIVYDIVNVVEGRCRLRQALIRDKRLDGMFLLPAAQSREKDAVSPEQMQALCTELKGEFDYVIIDSPAGIERGFRNAVAGAEMALIVTTPEVSAVRDADRIVGLLEAAGLKSPFLIINRYRPVMVKKGDMMDVQDVLDILAIKLMGVIPEDESIVVSTNKGEPAVMDSRSRAGAAFKEVAARLDGEESVDYSALARNRTGFWTAFKRFAGLGGSALGREDAGA